MSIKDDFKFDKKTGNVRYIGSDPGRTYSYDEAARFIAKFFAGDVPDCLKVRSELDEEE